MLAEQAMPVWKLEQDGLGHPVVIDHPAWPVVGKPPDLAPRLAAVVRVFDASSTARTTERVGVRWRAR